MNQYLICLQFYVQLNKWSLFGKYESSYIIRRIHHFGNKVWLGRKERIKAIYYEEVDGKDGLISIMTSNGQFIVPRQKFYQSNARITLCKKRIYDISQNENTKELVIVDGKPKLIDYCIKDIKSVSDFGNGIKGSILTKRGEELLVI